MSSRLSAIQVVVPSCPAVQRIVERASGKALDALEGVAGRRLDAVTENHIDAGPGTTVIDDVHAGAAFEGVADNPIHAGESTDEAVVEGRSDDALDADQLIGEASERNAGIDRILLAFGEIDEDASAEHSR